MARPKGKGFWILSAYQRGREYGAAKQERNYETGFHLGKQVGREEGYRDGFRRSQELTPRRQRLGRQSTWEIVNGKTH